VREFERRRPAAKGKLRVREVFSGGAEPYTLGHRHVFLPGQVNRFAKEMDLPWQRMHSLAFPQHFGQSISMLTTPRTV
jgi:hypothetical protein